jgi:hypothetical protein
MEFGICNLNIIPLRKEASDTSEMVSQLLFGDHFKILEVKMQWLYIQVAFDGYQGWIDKKQMKPISADFYKLLEEETPTYIYELLNSITLKDNSLMPISFGARLPIFKDNILKMYDIEYRIDSDIISGKQDKSKIVEIAFNYLNTPYLWGGKSPFGIDCSGFTQMVYRLNGYKLYRDASQQAKQGEVLSFIEESEPGDLAFFDNSDGFITHVGIILSNNYIIHASGKVRLDRLDQSGIFNEETNRHTHNLRVIKKIF